MTLTKKARQYWIRNLLLFIPKTLFVCVVLEYGLLHRGRKLVNSGWKQGSQNDDTNRKLEMAHKIKLRDACKWENEIYLEYQTSRYNSCFVFGRSCVQVSNRRAANLTEVSPCFHQSLRRISGWIVPGIRTRIFFPVHYSLFILSFVAISSELSVVK
jgi:hypothetical protein